MTTKVMSTMSIVQSKDDVIDLLFLRVTDDVSDFSFGKIAVESFGR